MLVRNRRGTMVLATGEFACSHQFLYCASNAPQVCNFLNAMEFEIEGVDREADGNGKPPGMPYDGADFQPMRRRMYVADV